LHYTLQSPPRLFLKTKRPPANGVARLFYRSLQRTIRLIVSGLDVLLARLVSLLGAGGSSSLDREAVLAALNGRVGDYLAETRSPLAITMSWRRDGVPLELKPSSLTAAISNPTGKLLLMVHGLCMNDLQWPRGTAGTDNKQCHPYTDDGFVPSVLAEELGYTAVYLHYNSGRHISINGHQLAELVETLVANWPVPVEELTIVAHSMGGLIARSACHYGGAQKQRWLRHLKQMIFLGTPHHGVPRQRSGNWEDFVLGISPYTAPFARLGKIRSAGITDLRDANLVDEDWWESDRLAHSHDPHHQIPLPEGVLCYAVAATTGKQVGNVGDRFRGDGLVPLNSALGQHDDPALSLPFFASSQWIGCGMNHLDLIRQPEVFTQLRTWLAAQVEPANTLTTAPSPAK